MSQGKQNVPGTVQQNFWYLEYRRGNSDTVYFDFFKTGCLQGLKKYYNLINQFCEKYGHTKNEQAAKDLRPCDNGALGTQLQVSLQLDNTNI